MEVNLKRYEEEEKKLIHELKNGNLSYEEAQDRCATLWDLIPSNVFLNPLLLNNLMKEKFSNHLDWGKYSKKYTLKISDIKDEDIEEYIQSIANKLKSYTK